MKTICQLFLCLEDEHHGIEKHYEYLKKVNRLSYYGVSVSNRREKTEFSYLLDCFRGQSLKLVDMILEFATFIDR